MDRRAFLGRMLAVAGTAYVGPSFLRPSAAGAAVIAGTGPYGTLEAADANGLQLPAGFTSRVIATAGQQVAATGYAWHGAPDGGACFPVPGGGWVYASNSEVGASSGGVSAVRFAPGGAVTAAYRILSGTNRNCSGGPTPWGTWLSCEEAGAVGKVYECNPQQQSDGVERPLLGSFNHEAAVVDPATGHVYLTEDDAFGRLYRFQPTTPGDLSSGTLHAASVSGSTITWVPVSTSGPARDAGTTAFNGGEGAWISAGTLWFTTKGDRRVWELDLVTQQLTVLFAFTTSGGYALNAVDNITCHEPSGDLYIAEDGGNMELCLIAEVGGQDTVAAFLRFVGHDDSEVAGPAFSPDGTRLYVSSQRGTDGSTGVTYEITGPFRTVGPPPPPPPPPVVVAEDGFGRTVAAGSWGSADVGGVWSRSGTASNFSVSGGAGRIVVSKAGATLAAALPAVSVAEVDATVDLSLDKAPTGGGTIVSLVARQVAGADYRLRAYLRPSSVVQLLRVVNGTVTTVASASLALPGGAYVPGQVMHLRFRLTGSGPTALAGKVWFGAAAEPAAWQVQAVDATAQLQQPGGLGVEAYVSSSSTNVPVTLSADNLRATTPGAEPPPQNVAPTAAFTAASTGLTVALDASSSHDPDGTIATYAWAFGDGATSSGASPTVSHTYAAAGTYSASLTVTDDRGGTHTTSQSVTVTAPVQTLVAQDGFGRTVAAGSWGSADVGGVWSRSGTASNFSVSGGAGRIVVSKKGATLAAALPAVSVAEVDATVDLSLDKAPTGGGTIVSLVARQVAGADYRLRAYLRSSSVVQLLRVVNGSVTTVASASLALPGGAYVPGQVMHLRFRLTGSGPTALAGKVWFGAAAEPAAWQVQAVDATAQLQQPGGLGVEAYVSSSSTNVPVTLSADNLRAVRA